MSGRMDGLDRHQVALRSERVTRFMLARQRRDTVEGRSLALLDHAIYRFELHDDLMNDTRKAVNKSWTRVSAILVLELLDAITETLETDLWAKAFDSWNEHGDGVTFESHCRASATSVIGDLKGERFHGHAGVAYGEAAEIAKIRFVRTALFDG